MCYTFGVKPERTRIEGRTAALAAVLAACVGACSGSPDGPLVEYPPLSDPPAAAEPEERSPGDAGAPSRDASGPEPSSGKKIASGSIFLRGVTSDGALVFEQDADLMIWPDGAAAPVRLVQDFSVGEDSAIVRGRVVAAWLGDEIGASAPVLWTKTSGVTTSSAKIYREAIYPKHGADDFAYLAPSTSSLRRDVWSTKAGGGAGAKIVSGLALGYPEEQCRSSIAYSATDLVVAGCSGGGATPKVVAYALDGSNTSKTILDGSAPGIFFNRARTRAVVQTAAASSIRALSGAGAPVPLDGPVRQAFFSSDDAKVVYLGADKKVRRASTSTPASPADLAPSALVILGVSPDARFVVVGTTGDPSKNRTDLVALDANAAGASPRTLVQKDGTLVGMSTSGATVVYLDDPNGALDPPLRVASLPGGAPHTLSPASAREIVDGDVVYWQEFDEAQKANVLKAAPLANPSAVVTVADGLDPLTATMRVVGKKLFIASKLGLWELPALTP